VIAPWKLPLIVAGIALPVAAAFMVGGPGVGVAVGALAAVAILVVAARQSPRGPIGSAAGADAVRRVLLVITRRVDEPAAIRRVIEAAGLEESDGVEVLVLAPARIGFLDRWASDVENARRRAQEALVATVAALAAAGIAAEARVGDEDVMQAVEDQIQSFPATIVVLVSGEGEDAVGDPVVGELGSRLEAPFRHISFSSPGR
jgi:hypothetical protein